MPLPLWMTEIGGAIRSMAERELKLAAVIGDTANVPFAPTRGVSCSANLRVEMGRPGYSPHTGARVKDSLSLEEHGQMNVRPPPRGAS